MIGRSLVLVMFCVVLLVGSAARPAHGQDRAEPALVLYTPPILTAVIDPFRPPAHIGAPGNRGLEYGNSDNQIVAAAAGGYVTHAGPVAGRKTITIEHSDGVRTTYTGLLELWVVEGMNVRQGSAIARASRGFHFGARLLDHYLDPQILIDASLGESRPRLVPPD